MLENNEIMIYEDKNGITKINVKFVNEDIWLTQNQIAEIYKTTQQNISQHINSIYKDNELLADSTNKKFLLVQQEGNRNVKRNIDHYNLDMIIALGYREEVYYSLGFKLTRKYLKDEKSSDDNEMYRAISGEFLLFNKFRLWLWIS